MNALHHKPNLADRFLTRRDFLTRCGMGFGMLSLANILAPHLAQAGEAINNISPLAPKASPFPAKAKRVIHIFANGGPSHVDTFDPKPELARLHGKPLPMDNLKTERKTGAAFQSPFKFKKHGQSGIEVSELFSNVAEHIDDIAVIRSMNADVPNHEPSLLLMNCGEARLPRPSMGSWVTYGLGTVNQNLPGFITMCPGGYPIQESQNWQSAFLPGIYQGTYINTKHEEIEKLIEHIKNKSISMPEQRQELDVLRELNEQHARRRAQDAQLEARIQSFELAYRMQIDATDAFDVAREPEHVRKMYGPGTQARQLLIARRLLERGVRFVQVWSGADNGFPRRNWDSHEDIARDHEDMGTSMDIPAAALLKDLKARGLLDDTIVIWTTEFGRMPCSQGSKGRDHNPFTFTSWLAGGGIRGGTTYGSSDEWSYKAVDKPTYCYDLHATLLHLLGIDHEKLTFRHNGIDRRLTDVHGHVINDLLA
jgi:hypothetical protein